MKKTTLLILAFLAANSIFAQICPTNSTLEVTPVVAGSTAPVPDDLDFVSFNPNNSNEAWAMGKSGGLSKLTFSNNVWTAQQQNTSFAVTATQRFKYLHFVSNNYWLLSGDGAGNSQSDSGNIYLSTNQGSTWTKLGGGVPGGPIYFVITHSQHTNWMIVGTRNGLFVTSNTGANWNKQSQLDNSEGSITTRMYSAILDEATGKITIAARSGNIVSATITDFTTNDHAWVSELNSKTNITIGANSVEYGSADVSWVVKSGNTRWAATSNENGAAIIKSVNNAAWEAVPVPNFDPLIHLEARWIAVTQDSIVVFGDDIGNIFYTTNGTSQNPTWDTMQANQPNSIGNGSELNNGHAIFSDGNLKLLVVGNLNDPSTGSLLPTMNYITCAEPLSVSNFSSSQTSIYPNPNNGTLYVLSENPVNLKVISNTGIVILNSENVLGNQSFDLSGVAAGVYFVQIFEGNTVRTEKLIIVN
jgi:photosystem II stability/assembly factor-like uncharacterized protein